ncbi:AraC-like DNA-binding protein [Kineothrix alysoides]|uniref:AraC-like DNA-binding protein n=1 Tax=Kineothrix alysoides TaxID=1469948 RepID=A0A4V2QB90_9FIRM|nr:AraC family transcriptional regulator [Kineothrix alysoides]TCL55462.1 AraC-like DNA-binding protein [Kineothrix alysoides]
MSYESITLKKEFIIDNLVSIHHYEYMSAFVLKEETHPFWELICVDKGTVNVTVNQETHTLNKDDIMFLKPGKAHSVQSNGSAAPHLIIIGFECGSPSMNFFEHKVLEVTPLGSTLLGNIIREAYLTYSGRMDDPTCQELIRREETSIPFASEQLIQLYLLQLLIQLKRSAGVNSSSIAAIPKSSRQRGEDELFYKIVAYMEENISTKLTIQQICKDNLVGRSLLQKMFKDHTSCGIIDYFTIMKINAAKQLICGQQMNFSQIADKLGYNSIHYFSRQFKHIAGMTPSEYQASVKAGHEPPAL